MLNEEVIKEIERRTPYRVVGTKEEADTTLEGEVNFTDKNIIVENPFNLPRQLTATLTVNFTWTDNQGEADRRPRATDDDRRRSNFFPEVGETSEAAFLRPASRWPRRSSARWRRSGNPSPPMRSLPSPT